MNEPHLLIDAGNSRIKWALADAQRTLVETGAFGHTRDGGADPDWSNLPHPRGAWISNVAGADVAARLDALLDARWPGLPRTTIRSRHSQCGVTNGYTTPEQLGSDRWAGLIGAHAAFPGEHLLIATFGTATTLEALRADGRFTGGLIAPGWALMMRALGTHTAQLPTLTTDIASGLLAGRRRGGRRRTRADGAAYAARCTDPVRARADCGRSRAGLTVPAPASRRCMADTGPDGHAAR